MIAVVVEHRVRVLGIHPMIDLHPVATVGVVDLRLVALLAAILVDVPTRGCLEPSGPKIQNGGVQGSLGEKNKNHVAGADQKNACPECSTRGCSCAVDCAEDAMFAVKL